ncbi:uncharacterized protein N7469_006252 [Penicillium citrinum]|uniref:Uncharacterized protein n=1 Tax=Penicillium citrinum TaxID=5077 RepID=A0A9W9NXM1_PENCI|nr:uncharacterized protein N7469_006252 [Penicillium citrinum]KAJ5231664.1 hypothetical protein N7469_006252 [Penicillium citrinum]
MDAELIRELPTMRKGSSKTKPVFSVRCRPAVGRVGLNSEVQRRWTTAEFVMCQLLMVDRGSLGMLADLLRSTDSMDRFLVFQG